MDILDANQRLVDLFGFTRQIIGIKRTTDFM